MDPLYGNYISPQAAAAALGLHWIYSESENGKGVHSFVIPLDGQVIVKYDDGAPSYRDWNSGGMKLTPTRFPTYTLKLPAKNPYDGSIAAGMKYIKDSYIDPYQGEIGKYASYNPNQGAKGTSVPATKENNVFSTGASKAVGGFRGTLSDGNYNILWESPVVPTELDDKGYDKAEEAARNLAKDQLARIQKAVVTLGDAPAAVTA